MTLWIVIKLRKVIHSDLDIEYEIVLKDDRRAARKIYHKTTQLDLDVDELPREDAPGKATLTTKTIDDNDYYWQWREGDTIKSEYVRPVEPKE